MGALLSSVLGAHASELIDAFTARQPEAYLHDMVACTAPRVSGLTFASHLRLHSLVLRAHAPGGALSPGAVHALVWANERRLHHSARLLGSIELEGASTEAADALARLSAPTLDGYSGGDKARSSAALAQLDLGVASAVVDAAWRQTSAAMAGEPESDATQEEAWRAALSRARLVAADVDALLLIGAASCGLKTSAAVSGASLPAPSSSKAAIGPPPPGQAMEATAADLGKATVRWRALVVVHIFAQEVLLASHGAAAAHPTGTGAAGVERQALHRLVDAACGFCVRSGEQPVGSSKVGLRALLQAAAAAAAPVDTHDASRLGGFVFALARDVVLRLARSGQPFDGTETIFSDLVDLVAGTATWLPPLAQPARELLLHALHDAAASPSAPRELADAVDRLCTRGVGGCVLALRHEERRLRLQVAEAANQDEYARALRVAERELQAAVRLASAADAEAVDTASKGVHGKGGMVQLTAASKAKMLLGEYTAWLAAELRRGKTTLEEPLPTAEPVRVLCESLLLSTRPLALSLFVLRQLYRIGGPSLLRKLLAVPSDVSGWVPVSAAARKPLQSSKKKTVANPFSLLISPAGAAAREYVRMHSLASEVRDLQTTDSKKLDKIVEALEALGARDGVRSHDNSVVVSLVAATFYLIASKPKLGHAQKLAKEKAEAHRLATQYGARGAEQAAKTEEFLKSAAADAVVQLVTRRFEAQKVRDLLLYVLGGCEGNALLPNALAAQHAAVDAITMDSLFGAHDSGAPAGAGPAGGGGAADGADGGTAALTQRERRRGGGNARSHAPRGVESRRGPGEGFIAGLNVSIFLGLRVASHAASSFWATLLFAPAALSTMFVPTMAGDEFAMILAASEFVGWYKCPNGHPYSVGNCTMPMQLARCPACNAPIGGANHTAVAGVTRMGHSEDLKAARKDKGTKSAARRGYNRDDLNLGAGGLGADMVPRAGSATTRVIRIFMHLLLHLHGSSTGRWQALFDVLKPPTKGAASAAEADGGASSANVRAGSNGTPTERAVRSFLEDCVLADWKGLQDMFGLDEEQAREAVPSHCRTTTREELSTTVLEEALSTPRLAGLRRVRR